MSWIKARAYTDGDFVLGLLLTQLESDVEEANALPSSARSHMEFEMKREERVARIVIAFTDSDVTDVVRIGAQEGVVMVVLLEPQGRSRHIRITASWDAESEQEQWFIDDEESPLTIAEVSRAILEPTLFGT